MKLKIVKGYHRRVMLFGLGTIIVFLFLVGISYAVWMKTLVQEGENVVSTSCFDVSFLDEDSISFLNSYPILDREGKNLTPYTFTLKNSCDTYASYQIHLEVLNETTLLNHDYIKLSFNEQKPRILTYYDETTKTLSNAISSYTIDTGFLNPKETKVFTLRLWMDEDTPPVEDAMNKIFQSKITITSSFLKEKPNETGVLRSVEANMDTGEFDSQGLWSYRDGVKKIVIQDALNPIDGADKVFDESEAQDGSAMSYILNTDDGYVAYLQGDGKIKANPNSSFLFAGFDQLTTIEGLENIDFSDVTNASYMFAFLPYLKGLDVSSMDTSKVTNMSYMFSGVDAASDDQNSFDINLKGFDTSSATNMEGMFQNLRLSHLDLSSFSTGNVTNMKGMFLGTNFLTRLDLSSFSTGNVIDMSEMFYGMSGLTVLNVQNFDTSNVTNMSRMFSDVSALTRLDLSSFSTGNVTNMNSMFAEMSSLTDLNMQNFDTSSVTNMSYMFGGDASLSVLDLSSFNTSNVHDMSGMFQNNSNLKQIIYGEFFIHKEDANIDRMFLNLHDIFYDTHNFPTHESWNGLFDSYL